MFFWTKADFYSNVISINVFQVMLINTYFQTQVQTHISFLKIV